jgi:hypothetical protein
MGEVLNTVGFAFIFGSAIFGRLRRDDTGKMRSEIAILVPISIKGIICFLKSSLPATPPNLNSYEGQAVHRRIDISNYVLDIICVSWRGSLEAFFQKALQHGKESPNGINIIRPVLESPIQGSFRLSRSSYAVSPEPQISKPGLEMDPFSPIELWDTLLERLEACPRHCSRRSFF